MSFFRIAIAPPDSRFHGGRKSRRRIGRPGPIDIILPAATHYARRGPPVRDFCISQEQDAPGDGSVVLQFRPRSRDRFIKLEAPCRTLSYRNEVRISPPEDAVELRLGCEQGMVLSFGANEEEWKEAFRNNTIVECDLSGLDRRYSRMNYWSPTLSYLINSRTTQLLEEEKKYYDG